MPTYQATEKARQKVLRIKEESIAYREESARMQEATKQTTKSALVVVRRKSSPKPGHVVPVGRVA